MSTRKYEPIAGITVGAAGSDSTIPFPTNRRLLLARLYAQATAPGPVTVYGADVVDGLQFYVGTKLIRDVTASELLYLAKLNGRGTLVPSASVGIPFFFAEPHRASVMDEQVTAWDLFGVPNMTVKARTKAGLTNPIVKVEHVYDDEFATNSKGERVLNIIKHEPVYLGSLGTTADIIQPNIPIDLPIQRIHIIPDAGSTINWAKVTINESDVIFDATQAENIEFLADYKLVAEAGNGKPFPVVFDANGQLFDGLELPFRSIKLSINQSVAGPVKLLLERRAPLYI
ncbi:hypothetical protein [Oleiharenicola sp. Vm1]|uniref:hypothetical protein n=1 Tax=Oleiharenicola sp. Vm1 TaxID=3398393 RepID=UPI0039F48D9E